MSKYSSYAICYSGDYAAVRMDFEKPVVTMSDKPKGKYHREAFQVTTTSETFNQAGIAVAVQDALTQKDYSTYVTLLNAQSTLKHYISENGSTDPKSEADWEGYEPHGCKALELAIA